MIRRAKSEIGNREYAGQHLSFIDDALEKSGGSAVFVGNSANDSSESYSSALRFGAPERGALVFYDCLCRGENAPANYGHCGIALDGGAVIHAWNDVRIDNYLTIEKLTSRNGDHLRYIGWVEIDRLLALKSADERSDSGCENVTSAKAIFELAMRHIYGDGVPEDNVFAFELLTRAHEMGHIEASYNLGICFHYGYGTDIDLKKPLSCIFMPQMRNTARAWSLWDGSITKEYTFRGIAGLPSFGLTAQSRAAMTRPPRKRERN